MSFKHLIHEERRSKTTPKSIVKDDRTCFFGTFDKEFEEMCFTKIKKPTCAPQFLNKLKLTLWEASELSFKEGTLLLAVSDMGIFGKVLAVFFDRRDKKVYTWDYTVSYKKANVSDNLLNGAITLGEGKNSFIKYVNDFQDGKARITVSLKDKCSINNSEKLDHFDLEVDVELTRLSLPCVVSIPFDEKKPRPLYSQKDFFKVSGTATLGGESLTVDDETTAIIDDHRGYYPRHAHYDWVTTMGKNTVNGEKQFFAFNLTRNQSIDQDKYNENLIWFEGSTSLLTPVTFERDVATKDFRKEGHATWTIKDEHGMVDIKFKIENLNAMVLHAGVVNIDYYITFGELEGYICDEDGNKYVLDGMIGIGEDKTLVF